MKHRIFRATLLVTSLAAMLALSCATMPKVPSESEVYAKLLGTWNADTALTTGGWGLVKLEFSDNYKVTMTDDLPDGRTKATWFRVDQLSDGKLWMTLEGNSFNDGKPGELNKGFIFRFVDDNTLRFGWDPTYYVTLYRE